MDRRTYLKNHEAPESMLADQVKFGSDRLAYHRQNPHISIDQYRSIVLHEFGKRVSSRKIVYLDLKYWINLRDASQGAPVPEIYHTLLALLRKLTLGGVAICPVSFPIAEEILKQADRSSRRRTGELVDELCLGAAFASHEQLIRNELLRFYRTRSFSGERAKSYPIRECVWNRAGCVAFDAIPQPPAGFAEDDVLAIQKLFEDHKFFKPFAASVDVLSSVEPEEVPALFDPTLLNEGAEKARKENRSYKYLYRGEVVQEIEMNEQFVTDTVCYLYNEQAKVAEPYYDKSKVDNRSRNAHKNLILRGLDEGHFLCDLPQYHIPAALYASIVRNKTQRFTSNWTWDIFHAQHALPYSDIFLTENGLKSLVCSKQLGLDKLYSTEVYSSPEESLERLYELSVPSCGGSKWIANEMYGISDA